LHFHAHVFVFLSFNDESSRRLPTQIQRAARRELLLFHQARSLNDQRVPYGNHLEGLKDDRAGQHSIRVNDQWRICFRCQGRNAFDLDSVRGSGRADLFFSSGSGSNHGLVGWRGASSGKRVWIFG
jgi:proteic killer suppression protein